MEECMLETLLEIERSKWTNNPEIYEAGYLPNAVLIFPGVGRIDRSTAVNAIREENRKGHAWAEVKFEEARVVEVGAGVTLLTYKANARWNYEERASSVLCSTLYVRADDAWRIALHQQTPA
jgi:hypothetical protein